MLNVKNICPEEGLCYRIKEVCIKLATWKKSLIKMIVARFVGTGCFF